MKKFLLNNVPPYYFLLAILIWSCSSEDQGPKIDAAALSSIIAMDVGNSNGSGDIKVKYFLAPGHQLSELRITMVRANLQEEINSQSIEDLPAERSASLAIGVSPNTARLPEGLLDFHGEPIVNAQNYVIKVILVQNGAEGLANVVAEITLSSEPVLNGNYTGTWNDNLYTNFGISADLTFSNGILSGHFFYSSNFTSCCGGSNDGTIRVTIDELEISDFIYDQSLVSFMGGACPGEYTGSGQIEDDTTLRINFTGDDCEGFHSGGRITLSKVF